MARQPTPSKTFMTITEISSSSQILLDSDFLFGSFVDSDAHFALASGMMRKIRASEAKLVCLNLVIHESATLMSYKCGHDYAKSFVSKIIELPIVIKQLDQHIEESAWDIFLAQKKKGTSFIDCSNLAYLEHKGLDAIASFDQFYPKKLRLEL